MAIFASLREGQHQRFPLPKFCTKSIFPREIDNPMDFDEMRNHFIKWYEENGGRIFITYGYGLNQSDYTHCRVFSGSDKMVVYVTGLTPALISVVYVCVHYGIPLELRHYDASISDYKSEAVF